MEAGEEGFEGLVNWRDSQHQSKALETPRNAPKTANWIPPQKEEQQIVEVTLTYDSMRNFEPLSSTSCICLKTHIKELNGNPTMRLYSMPFLLLPLLLFSIPSPSFALKRAYVVYMGVLSHGAEVSEIDMLQVQESHFDLLGSFIGRDIAKESIFYSYTRHINGFAAMLEDEEASAISMDSASLTHKTNKGRGIPPADHHLLHRPVHTNTKLREWDV